MRVNQALVIGGVSLSVAAIACGDDVLLGDAKQLGSLADAGAPPPDGAASPPSIDASTAPDVDPANNIVPTGGTKVIDLIGGATAIAVDATHVYWTTPGTRPPGAVTPNPDGAVMRANKDGSDVSEFVGGQLGPVTVARFGEHVYWGGVSGDNPPIFRRSVNGGATASLDFLGTFWLVEDEANIYSANRALRQISKSTGDAITLYSATGPQLLSVAVTGGRVYFVDVNQRDIQSVPVGGGAVETVVSRSGSPNPYIVVDQTHVYWSNFGETSIWAAPLAGGAVTKVADTGGPLDKLAIHDGALYWTMSPAAWGQDCAGRSDGWPSLQTSPTTGGPVRTLASGYPRTNGFSANGLAFDETSVYWITGEDGCTPSVRNKVMRSPK